MVKIISIIFTFWLINGYSSDVQKLTHRLNGPLRSIINKAEITENSNVDISSYSVDSTQDLGQNSASVVLDVISECNQINLRISSAAGDSVPSGTCTVKITLNGSEVNFNCLNGACPVSCEPRTMAGLASNTVYLMTVTVSGDPSNPASISFMTKQPINFPFSVSSVTVGSATLTMNLPANLNNAVCYYTVKNAATMENAEYSCGPSGCNTCNTLVLNSLKPNTQYIVTAKFENGNYCGDISATFKTNPVTAIAQTQTFTRKIHAVYSFDYYDESMVCELKVTEGIRMVFTRVVVGSSCTNITVYGVEPNKEYNFELQSSYLNNPLIHKATTKYVNIIQEVQPQLTIGIVEVKVTLEPEIDELMMCAHFFDNVNVACLDCSYECKDFTLRVLGAGVFTSKILSPSSYQPSLVEITPDSVDFTLLDYTGGPTWFKFQFQPNMDVNGSCSVRLTDYSGNSLTPQCLSSTCPTDCNKMYFTLINMQINTNYKVYIDTEVSPMVTPWSFYTQVYDYYPIRFLNTSDNHVTLVPGTSFQDSIAEQICNYEMTAYYDPLKIYHNHCEEINIGNLVPASRYYFEFTAVLSIYRDSYGVFTKMLAPTYIFVHQLAATATLIEWSLFDQETELDYDFTVRAYLASNVTTPEVEGVFNRSIGAVYAYNLDARETYIFEVCTTVITSGYCPGSGRDKCDNCKNETIYLDVPPDKNPSPGIIYRDDDNLIRVTWPGAYMQLGIASCHLIIGSLRRSRSKPTYYVNSTDFNTTDLIKVVNGDVWRVHGQFIVSDCEGNRYVIIGNSLTYGGVVNYPLFSDFDISAIFVVCNTTHCLPSEPYEPFVVQTVNIAYYVLLAIGCLLWIVVALLAFCILYFSLFDEEDPVKSKNKGIHMAENWKYSHLGRGTGLMDSADQTLDEDFNLQFSGNVGQPSQSYLFNRSNVFDIIKQLKSQNSELLDKWWNVISNASSYGIGDISSTVRTMRNKMSTSSISNQLQQHLSNLFPGAKLIGGVENDSEYIMTEVPKNETLWSIANILKQYNINAVVVFGDGELQSNDNAFMKVMRGERKLDLPNETTLLHVKNDYDKNVEINTFSRSYSKPDDHVRFFFFHGWPEKGYPEISDLIHLRKLVSDWQSNQLTPIVIAGMNEHDAASIFLTIDYNMKRVENSLNTFNVVGIMSLIKIARNFFLSRQDSLVYIHEVLGKITDLTEKSIDITTLKHYVYQTLHQERNPLFADYMKYIVKLDNIDLYDVEVSTANKVTAVSLTKDVPGFEALDACIIIPASNKCSYIDCKNPNRRNIHAFLNMVKELEPSIIVHLGRKSDFSYYLKKKEIKYEDITATFDSPTKIQKSFNQVTMQMSSNSGDFSVTVVFYDKVDSVTASNITPEYVSIAKYVSSHLRFSKQVAPKVLVHSALPHMYSSPFIAALIYLQYSHINPQQIYYLQVMRSLRKARQLCIPDLESFEIVANLLDRML